MEQEFRFPAVGNLNGLDVIEEQANFTLSQRHIGKFVMVNSASAVTVTVPLMPGLTAGCNLILEATGAGTVTVASIAGTGGPPVLHPRGTYTTSIVSAGQYATIGLIYKGANRWNVSGDVTVT